MLDSKRRPSRPGKDDSPAGGWARFPFRPVGSPIQVSLGMMTLGVGIACLVFATLGGSGGSPTAVTATVTVTQLAAGAASPQLLPTPPAATPSGKPTPRSTRGGSATSVSVTRLPKPTAVRPGRPTASAPKTPVTTRSPQQAQTFAAADPSVNLAASHPVRISSHTQDYVAANVTDGDVNTYWESESGFPQTVTVDLGKVQAVGRLVFSLPAASDWNRRVQTIGVTGSRDGTGYARVKAATAYTFDANAASQDTVSVKVPRTRTRYLRLTFTANQGWTAAQLSELRVYSG